MCMSNQALMQAARQVLPFQLTPAQDRALAQISNDLLGSTPMLRLLQVRPLPDACQLTVAGLACICMLHRVWLQHSHKRVAVGAEGCCANLCTFCREMWGAARRWWHSWRC